MKQAWMILAALSAIAMIALPSMAGTPVFNIVLFAAGVLVAATLVTFGLSRRDRYSLDELREVHDKEQVRSMEVDDGHSAESLYCACCGTAYSVRFPACPHCAAPRS